MMIWENMNPCYKEMYIQQYEVDMPEIVNKLAPHISYWPSSPSAFGKMQDTDNENYGDSHDWEVWHGKPFYSLQRYVSKIQFGVWLTVIFFLM